MSEDSIAEAIAEASLIFDQMCQERHTKGAEKYGPLKFLSANTLEEAMEEVVDLANYARYTFIKLWWMNQQIDEATAKYQDTPIGDIVSGKPKLAGEQ